MYMHFLFWESYLYPTCSTPKLEGRYVTPEALRCWTRIPTKWAKQPMFNPKRIHLASCPGCFLDLLMNSESSTVCTVLIHGFSMWLPRFWTSDGRWKKVGWKWPVIGAIGFQKKWNLGKSARNCAELWSFWCFDQSIWWWPNAMQKFEIVGGSFHRNIPTVHGSLYLPIIVMPTWCRQNLGPLPLVHPQSSLFCWPLLALYPYGNGDTREDFLNHSNHLIMGVSHN